jgi:hypothetical protein
MEQNKVVDNQGQKVNITASAFKEMKKDYEAGVWMEIIKTAAGTHVIILPENFN